MKRLKREKEKKPGETIKLRNMQRVVYMPKGSSRGCQITLSPRRRANRRRGARRHEFASGEETVRPVSAGGCRRGRGNARLQPRRTRTPVRGAVVEKGHRLRSSSSSVSPKRSPPWSRHCWARTPASWSFDKRRVGEVPLRNPACA